MPNHGFKEKGGKRAAGYVDDALRAKGRSDFDARCSECMHFVARDRFNECQVVAGTISPSGWCEWFEKFCGDNLI